MACNEQEIRRACEDVAEGHSLASFVLYPLIARNEILGIGTARAARGYDPRILLNGIHGNDPKDPGFGFNVGWNSEVVKVPHDGTTVPGVRASSVAETILLAAWGGDMNWPLQRQAIDRMLMPQPKNHVYTLGTYGCRFLYNEQRWGLYAHPWLQSAVKRLPVDEQVGSVDLIRNDGSFNWRIPNEPGHVVSFGSHETIATMPVRAADIILMLPLIETPLYIRRRPVPLNELE